MRPIRRFAAALAALLAAAGFASPALSQSNPGADFPYARKAQLVESLKLPSRELATSLALQPLDPGAVDAVVQSNAQAFSKRLQIGLGRSVPDTPEAASTSLRWKGVRGGFAAQWRVSSPGAAALRVAIQAKGTAEGVELRFVGSGQPGWVYGPFLAAQAAPGEPLWSPVLEGEEAIVEIFAPSGAATLDLDARIAQVSHLFVSPANPAAESIAKASQFCEVDLICRSANDAALASAGRAVARMTFSDGLGGGTFLCTGTLLNPTGGSFIPYFYSAHHCINTQASANTLTTHWFYDRTGCGSGSTGPNYVQLPGGATLLYGSAFYDALLLRLNNTPPSGAFFAGWDAATLAGGAALTAIHHPAGDWKKVSLGTMGGFSSPTGSGTNYVRVNWNSIATGVTEGGSSGSGIFTLNAGDYRLRGGLYGGPSSCSASAANLHDYYSRFDQVYPSIAQYLNPASTTCNYTLSPTSVTVGSGPASGSVTVSTTAGCAWSASSDSTWLTISGGASGNGSGTVTYSIAANPGSQRVGTLTIAGRPFTVTQQAPVTVGTNLVANPGFEVGTASWSQSASGGFPIIFQNTPEQSLARTGSWYAWLGGYDNAVDTLYQDVTIPAGAAARLQFWYLIGTEEATTTTPFDTMVVAIANPITGARLATLATLSNLDRTTGWTQSGQFDLSAFAGQTVRLMFIAETDSSLITNFFLDDISLTASTSSAGANHTALWWNSNESGWGVNFNHQGDIVFGTLFTYDFAGQPMWLVLAAGNRQSGETFSGTLYRTTGPPFNANPFTPIGEGNLTIVGTMTVTFSGSTASLTYTVNGVTVTKSIQKQVFGSRAANCLPTTGSRAGLANYQDLWWNAAESGWGLNITHQDNTLFVTLFTYNAAGQGLWLVLPAGARQFDGSYSGDLYQTTGPAFNAQPFTPIGNQNLRRVGTMTLRFANGESGTLTYSVDGVTVVKQITRQVFGSPVPACS